MLFVARVMLAADPFGGMNARVVTGVALLVALAGWTLVSSAWSGAPGRALLEYDRALLYLSAFALFAAFGFTRSGCAGWSVASRRGWSSCAGARWRRASPRTSGRSHPRSRLLASAFR